jgi:methyltransferase (TIGR00027 family)
MPPDPSHSRQKTAIHDSSLAEEARGFLGCLSALFFFASPSKAGPLKVSANPSERNLPMATPCTKRAAIISAALAALLVLGWGAGLASAAGPQKISVTAKLNMGFRAISAQDPDPKTRNSDYLAEKIANWDVMRQRLGWTPDFPLMVKRFNQEKQWTFYYVTARTKHIDALLRKELKAGVKQVVIMGAGYDTRGYRYYKDYPTVKFFEVDLPAMSADKREKMSTKLPGMPNNVTYAPIDFDTQELGKVLASVGYQKDQKTFFIWEGVTMYLDAPAVEGTLQFIAGNAAPGSSVVFDYIPPAVVKGTFTKDPFAKYLAGFVASVGEPFKFSIEPDKCGAFLKKQGLKRVSNVGHDYLVKNYMTGSNGKPFGTLPLFFWIAQAKVPGT